MTTYIEVAQALVDAGYLTDADLEAAITVLEDALVVAAAEDAEDEAAEDYSAQKDIVAEVENWVVEDAEVGDYDALEADEDIIADAIEQELEDEVVMVVAEAVIDAAYSDAAAALLAAELIDEAYLDAVAATIADIWVMEED